VDSEVGKGTTFSIYLPASMENELLNEQLFISEHQGEGNILVMDDEDFMRDILSKMLMTMGYTVIEAVSGEEMLRLTEVIREEGKRIRCAIVDLTVPGGMSGKETFVKFNSMFPDVPVFASSGFSEDPIMARPRDFGFKDSIKKPFRAKELAQMMEKHKDVIL
jgi:DNA-binding NtrC family response regulator